MNPAELRTLVGWIRSTDVRLFEIRGPRGSVRIVVHGALAEESRAVTTRRILADAPGQFLTAHPLARSGLAPMNRSIAKGDVLGLLKTGAIYAPVISRFKGEVVGVFAEDGERVERGTPLFELRS